MTSGRGGRTGYESRVLLLALAVAAPGLLAAALLVAGFEAPPAARVALVALATAGSLALALALRRAAVRPLRTLANLLAALREEDFSFRARRADAEDALGLVLQEVNVLADTLREQRLGALEATALLRKVLDEIEAAVFAFDSSARLQFVNQAGERLLGRPAERLLGREAAELGLQEALTGAPQRVVERSFPGGSGRFALARSAFRQEGLPQQLLVFSDLSRVLREEERQAWQRLVRVLGHELNNSLAPIKSISASLESLLGRSPLPADWHDDVARGLSVIRGRAEALARFTEAYSRLARLPAPRLAPVAVGELVERVAGLETQAHVQVRPGPAARIRADADQLEQLLINLLRNAREAGPDDGLVELGWGIVPGPAPSVEIWVRDEGPGLPESANLFVPFFTTKPQGSGIGLVLCRQIAESHGGALALENRRDRSGCRASLRLPV